MRLKAIGHRPKAKSQREVRNERYCFEAMSSTDAYQEPPARATQCFRGDYVGSDCTRTNGILSDLVMAEQKWLEHKWATDPASLLKGKKRRWPRRGRV